MSEDTPAKRAGEKLKAGALDVHKGEKALADAATELGDGPEKAEVELLAEELEDVRTRIRAALERISPQS